MSASPLLPTAPKGFAAGIAPLMRWPLPALFSWGAAWAVFLFLSRSALSLVAALLLASALGACLALLHSARWRRIMVALGFPLSLLMSGQLGGLPAWIWLLPLALLALAYPSRSWGDAPLFPTPPNALQGLRDLAPLPDGALLLDAGCGLGHGLRELRRAYPQARIEGIEWSGLLARVVAWRCRWAKIHRGDMWAQCWRPYALVYVFQRPETMVRVWAKACAELPASAWLISLDFAIPDQQALASMPLPGGHSLWIYQMGTSQRPG